MPKLKYRCAAALLALCALRVFAQSIVLSPAVVPLKGEVGQSVSRVLTMRNDTAWPMDFEITAQDVIVRGGKRVFVEAGKLPGSVAATLVAEPRVLRVDPHRSGSATVMFTLPQRMEQRAVLAILKSRTSVPYGDRRAYMSLGTLFTFVLSDRVSISGRLSASPPTSGASARIVSTLVNDGDEPVSTTGVAVLIDGQGHLVGKAAFEPHRLLPGESATLSTEYAGELERGDFRVHATFDVPGRPLTLDTTLTVP